MADAYEYQPWERASNGMMEPAMREFIRKSDGDRISRDELLTDIANMLARIEAYTKPRLSDAVRINKRG